MVETVIGLLTTVAICYLVLWLVKEISVPEKFSWVVKAVVGFILLAYVLDKYGVLGSIPKVAGGQ